METLKARLGIFCCFLVIFSIINGASLCAVVKSSIVICAETGKILHEKNADTVTPPASLTKMMTLYLTFKALREGRLTFDQKISVSKRASMAAPCKLWLKPGSTITVREAILGMVTKSANDASIAMAEALGKGSEPHFTVLMTQQARQLGMTKTVFKNSHGLPEKSQSVTSARDMAILSQCLYKDFREYFKFFKVPEFDYKGQKHANHNRLLGKIPGLDGIKTGFINASGFNLAASVVRDNRRIIAVVMGGESANKRNNEMVKLLETTYSKLAGKRYAPSKKDHPSPENLICAFEHSVTKTAPLKATMHQGVCRGRSKGKVQNAKYTSMEDILDSLPKQKISPKKRVLRRDRVNKSSSLQRVHKSPKAQKTVKKRLKTRAKGARA